MDETPENLQPPNPQVPLNPPPPPFQQADPGPHSTPETLTPKNRSPISLLALSRKLVILFIILIVLTPVGYFAYKFYASSQQEQEQPQASADTDVAVQGIKAEVTYLTGDAWKMVDDRKTEMRKGDILLEADEISTDEETRLVLTFDDGSVVRIGDNTNLVLTKLQASEMILNESQGALFARVAKDEEHVFKIVAGEVTVESLGTVFSVEKDEEVEVNVFEKKVKITLKDSETEIGENFKWKENTKEAEIIQEIELAQNQFLTWSLEEDKKMHGSNMSPEPSPTPEPTPTPKPVASDFKIQLTATVSTSGVQLGWNVVNLDTSQGFKVIKSLEENPSFPEDSAALVSEPSARSYFWKLTDGKEWHIRVCRYISGECAEYSNEIIAQTHSDDPEKESQVDSIFLTLEKVTSYKIKARWEISGKSPSGYKLLWSQEPNPTYPEVSGKFVGSTETSYFISGLQEGKTYHVRICEYLGGKCGTYSNDASITL